MPDQAPDDWLLLSQPDMSEVELELVQAALGRPRISSGPMVEHFEARFAQWLGRKHAAAVASGTLGTWLVLRSLGIGPGDEVIASSYGWHPVAQAVALTGARIVFSDIDYWSGCLDPVRATALVTPATRAAIVGNVNGHPAAWNEWRQLADARGLKLIEDSTEAIGSRYAGQLVGSFGDAAVFDFAQPSALGCGEGGMIVTDDDTLASRLRSLRADMQAGMSELTAALDCGQLARIDAILARRKQVEEHYLHEMRSFEGIKPPYIAPDVDEVHWMLWLVHLGKRFTPDACAQIVEDLATEWIEAVMYCKALHARLPLAQRIAERALALPLHGALAPEHVRFIVKTLKDSSVNVGAGAAIYL